MARRPCGLLPSKQIELVTTFADQAVIAIENVRLFDEVQARTRELSESLEQQTATSEMLRVISTSPGELEPVFRAMLANATRLCGAKFGILNLYDGEAFTNAAFHGVPEALQARLHELIRPHPRSGLAEIARTRQVVQIEDITARLPYRELSPAVVALADLGGARTLLLVPMLQDDKLIGAIGIYRQEVKPFTDKQIELVKTSPSRPSSLSRTRGCSTSCANRCSNRPLPPTCSRLSAARRSICRLCSIRWSSRRRGCVKPIRHLSSAAKATAYRLAANYGLSRDFKAYCRAALDRAGPRHAGRTSGLEGRTVHIPDVRPTRNTPDRSDRAWRFSHHAGCAAAAGGSADWRIPLSRARRCGRLPTSRSSWSTTFADQAVIAIENVRLFDEVQARTRELTQSVEELRALGEVSQAVNSTLDLQTVLDTIVAKATQLSGTEAGAIYVFDEADQQFQLRATYGMTADMIAVIKEHHADFSEAVRAATQRREPDQVADLQPSSRANELIMRLGYRARLVVPLLGARSDRGSPGGPPQGTRRVLSRHGRTAADLRGPIRAGDPECAPVRAKSRTRTASCKWRARISRSSSPA